jgi:uncharacterized peroxidase-related enzyme
MTHHGESLRRLVGDEELVAQLKEDYTQAQLSAADRTMLDYAARLTRTPSAIEEGHVEALRCVGFSDRAILDVAQITAYFAFVNRLAEGLGVGLEDYWARR